MDRKILIQELSEGLAQRKDIPLKDAEMFVRSVFEIVQEYLQTDKLVKIKGFGTFKLVRVESRESVDVNTGERIVINGYTKVAFTPDTTLRDEINKPFAQFETVVLYENTDLSEMEKMDLQEADSMLIQNETEENVQTEAEQSENADTENTEDLGSDISEEGDEESDETSDVKEEVTDAGSDDENTNQDDLKDDEDIIAGGNDEKKDEVALAEDLTEEVADRISANDVVGQPVADEDAADVHQGSVLSSDDTSERDNAVASSSAGSEKPSETMDHIADMTGPCDSDDCDTASSVVTSQHVEYLNMGYQHVDHQRMDTQEVKRQKVDEQSAGNQNIEVQHVENQTVENQHIVQMAPSSRRRRRIPPVWLMVLSVLIVLLLMLGSYFIGYYRLLCPGGCNIEGNVVPILPVTSEHAVDTTSSVIVPEKSQSSMADTVKASPANTSDSTRKAVNKTVNEPEKKVPVADNKTQAAASQKNPDRLYPQLEGGRYQIVGTKQIYSLQQGETLRNIALKYYGSKNFVPYIVVYNQIKNPDVIPVGQKLKLPELRLREP